MGLFSCLRKCCSSCWPALRRKQVRTKDKKAENKELMVTQTQSLHSYLKEPERIKTPKENKRNQVVIMPIIIILPATPTPSEVNEDLLQEMMEFWDKITTVPEKENEYIDHLEVLGECFRCYDRWTVVQPSWQNNSLSRSVSLLSNVQGAGDFKEQLARAQSCACIISLI